MSAAASGPPEFGAPFRAALAGLLRWRRDVRHFRPDPLPEGALERLLGLAALAPSVGLSQPWRFVLVEAPARRAALRANFARCNAEALAAQPAERAALYARLKLEGMEAAPCLLALFALPDPAQGHGLGRRTMPETAAYSAVLAAHTLWLAARAEGIGLGWVSVLEPEAAAAALEVPADWRFIGLLCLGYPEAPAERPALEAAGWEHRRPPELLRR